jgi:uncharacterized membrane protein YjjP (DUF1212 family)
MILLTAALAGISIFTFKKYIQKGQKKETAVFFAAVSAAFAMGSYYLLNPHGRSLTKILLDLFHIVH